MTKIYEAKNHILIRAGYAAPAEHCHKAAHIIISMSDKIRVLSDGAEYLCHGIMIPSGLSHTVETHSQDVLVFLYDCTSHAAKQIQNIQCIPRELCRHIAEAYTAIEQDCTADVYGRFETDLLTRLGIRTSADPTVQDERIRSAMRYIRSMCREKITCRDVADAVHLSQGRFSHLFKEQVGMTFAAYLIYQRLMSVYTQTFRGKSITESALEAGFASSAHFADVNRRVFGISAGSIAHRSTFIKIQ